jgi:asparagine synthase (glutamine-hydrolysing)
MLAIQNHRGPDFTGRWSSEGAYIGHNRLSIIDLGADSNQPFKNGRYVLTFNGEIYNYLEIKQELPEYNFTTNGDTEVLLAAFLKWGKDCLKKLRGMFAFAIYDTETRELFAARDRFGVKPFHYAMVNGEFVFASEIKAILASGLLKKQWNEKVWANYLSFAQYNMEQDTFYDGIEQIKPGETHPYKRRKNYKNQIL